MAKMTVQQVAALKAKEKPYKQNVDTGLQLRIATDGAKTWIVQYVINGKQREYRLPKLYGTVTDAGHLSLLDARNESAKIRALAREGIDYQKKQEEDRLEDERRRQAEIQRVSVQAETQKTENLTVQDLFDAWLQDGVRRKDGNAELERSFKADVLPKVGGISIKALTEHDLRGVLRAIADRGANRTSVVARNNLMQMFVWAEQRQPWRKLLVDGNPMNLIDIENIVNSAYDLHNQRDRILSTDEIRELRDIFSEMQTQYDLAPDKRFGPQPVEKTVQHAIWIMLSTLCRVGELSMAQWKHVDLETGTWFIPKENVKGNLSNLTVYLSEFALNQFQQLHARTGKTDWCFPAKNREGHVCVKSTSKQVGDRQSMFKKSKDGGPRKPMKNRRHDNTLVLGGGKDGAWTPHDLRRTGATMMQSLGVALDIIDRCQNHVLAGSKVRRHYMHHDYKDETREAWRLLGDRLSLILNPVDNVVPFVKSA
jgi:integrase